MRLLMKSLKSGNKNCGRPLNGYHKTDYNVSIGRAPAFFVFSVFSAFGSSKNLVEIRNRNKILFSWGQQPQLFGLRKATLWFPKTHPPQVLRWEQTLSDPRADIPIVRRF